MSESLRRYKILKQRLSKLIKSDFPNTSWITEAKDNLEVLKQQLGIH